MKETVVAVIDFTGRASALIKKYSEDERVKHLVSIPGNEGMELNSSGKPVKIFQQLKTSDTKAIVGVCEEVARNANLLVDVSQDEAIKAGVADALRKREISVIGAGQEEGRIETSKAWERKFGEEIGLLQPGVVIFQNIKHGIEYINNQPNQRRFIKADGLDRGKGALPAENNKEAIGRIREIRTHGKPARKYLIEEWLTGEEDPKEKLIDEFSAFAIGDGKNYKIVGFAEDHKRINRHDAEDEGPNTGGMGCNTLFPDDEMLRKVDEDIFRKTFEGLQERGLFYKGILYLGGMRVKQKGSFLYYVIEFNARWGDPEAQIIVPGIKGNLFEIGMAIAHGNISKTNLETDGKPRIVFTCASKGYPYGKSEISKGKEITGIDEVRKIEGVTVLSGSMKVSNGKYYANGAAREFCVVVEGKSITDAHDQFTKDILPRLNIKGDNLVARDDIGHRAIEREKLKRFY